MSMKDDFKIEGQFLAEDSPLLIFEQELWAKSYKSIAGVDEAGRGPLAGPVVAAAVVLRNSQVKFPPVFDSKQLSAVKRKELRMRLLADSNFIISTAEISPDEIDEINILRATHKAMREALAKIADIDFVLVDGLPVRDLPYPSKSIVKGDSKSALIAAASIIAKVHRDEIMERLSHEFPEYGFEKHKGYGTVEHIDAIRRFGPCSIHRKSFEPIRSMLSSPDELPLVP
jgi:ribonuclease HII